MSHPHFLHKTFILKFSSTKTLSNFTTRCRINNFSCKHKPPKFLNSLRVIMSSSSNQPSLYSPTPSNSISSNLANSLSPFDRKFDTDLGSIVSKPSLSISHFLNDGDSTKNESSTCSSEDDDDDELDVVWSSVDTDMSNNDINKFDYMLYIITKMVERHREIATLGEDESFRTSGQKQAHPRNTGKRGRKRKGK